MAAVLFSGSAAFAVAANEAMVKWAGAAAALAGATSLVMGFSEKARRHAALAERFKQIEADIHEVGEYDYTPEQVAAWQARIVRLEAHEPPTRHILARMCQNDMAFAVGQPDKMTHIPVVQRLLAHFVSFSAQNAQIKPS
ncbi:MAG: hypothetical protein LBR95_02250 [Azoarcus sp.]|nr:hypothetical protein [Azoarcus sp.]